MNHPTGASVDVPSAPQGTEPAPDLIRGASLREAGEGRPNIRAPRATSSGKGERWLRAVYGKKSVRLKDIELVLRFFAFADKLDEYERPLKTFLNEYLHANRNPSNEAKAVFTERFETTISLARRALGDRAFRPAAALNTAVFDSVMVGLERRIRQGGLPNEIVVKEAYEGLLADGEFVDAYVRATADEEAVSKRMRKAIEAFDQT